MFSQVVAKSKDGTKLAKRKDCTSDGSSKDHSNECQIVPDGKEKIRSYTGDMGEYNSNKDNMGFSQRQNKRFLLASRSWRGRSQPRVNYHLQSKRTMGAQKTPVDATLQVLDKDRNVLWEKQLLGMGNILHTLFQAGRRPRFPRDKTNFNNDEHAPWGDDQAKAYCMSWSANRGKDSSASFTGGLAKISPTSPTACAESQEKAGQGYCVSTMNMTTEDQRKRARQQKAAWPPA